MPVAIVANAIWFLNYVLSLRGRRVNQMTDGKLDLPAKASAEKQDPCPDASKIDTETFVEKCSETPERGVLSLTSQDSTSSELQSTPLAPDQELDGDASSKPSSAIEEEEPSSLNHLEDSKATCTEMDTLADVKNTKDGEEKVKPPQIKDTDETCTDRELEAVEEKLTCDVAEKQQLHLEDSKATCTTSSEDMAETKEREDPAEEEEPQCDVTEEAGMTLLKDSEESCKDGEASATSTSSIIKEEEHFYLNHSKATYTAMDILADLTAETKDKESPVEEEVNPQRDVTEETGMTALESVDESCTDGSTSTASITIEEEEPSSQLHLEDSKATCIAIDTLADVTETERENTTEEDVKPPLCETTEEVVLEDNDESCKDGEASCTSTSSTIKEEEPSSLNHLVDSKTTCTGMDTLADVKNTITFDREEEVKPPQFEDTDKICTEREAVEEVNCDVTEEAVLDKSCTDGEERSTSTSSTTEVEEPSSLNHLKDSKATCTALALVDVSEAQKREDEAGMTALESVDESCRDGESGSTSTASSTSQEEEPSQLHLEDSKSTCTALALDISVDVRESKERENPAEEEVNPPQIMCDVTEKPRDEDPSNPVEQRLYRCTVNVPRTCVGRLIGKNGRNIKTVMNRTGTNISILQRKAKPEDCSIPCRIQGSWIDIRTATELIRTMFPAISSPTKRPKLIKKLSGH